MHFKEYRFLEIILDTKHLKHKTLHNKSISIFWCEHLFSIESEQFSFESYICKLHSQSTYHYLNKVEMSKLTHRMQYAPQEAKQALQDIIGNYILLCCPPNANILQTVMNTDETFCIKLKPLASNKCILVPASMERIHLSLTNAKMSKCSSRLLPPHTLWTCDSLSRSQGKWLPQCHQSSHLQFILTGNCHDVHYQHSVYENQVNRSYVHTL